MPSPSNDHLALLSDLLVSSSRFTRAMSRQDSAERSAVAWRLLSNLEHRGALRVTELADLEKISQPAMTGVVNKLEAAHLVTREPDPDDKRAHHVVLTPLGSKELHEFRQRTAAHAAPALANLSEFDVSVLKRATELVQIITETIEKSSHENK